MSETPTASTGTVGSPVSITYTDPVVTPLQTVWSQIPPSLAFTAIDTGGDDGDDSAYVSVVTSTDMVYKRTFPDLNAAKRARESLLAYGLAVRFDGMEITIPAREIRSITIFHKSFAAEPGDWA